MYLQELVQQIKHKCKWKRHSYFSNFSCPFTQLLIIPAKSGVTINPSWDNVVLSQKFTYYLKVLRNIRIQIFYRCWATLDKSVSRIINMKTIAPVIVSNIDVIDNFTQIIVLDIATDCSIVEQFEFKNIVDEFSWTLETERKLNSSFEMMRKVNL